MRRRPSRCRVRASLFILADDQRWDTIPRWATRRSRRPTSTRLVERGFHFTNAYCMGSMIGAVCLPSRTMLITGRSLWRIPANPRATAPRRACRCCPSCLRKAGYVTFHCGKASNSCTFGNAAFDTNIETAGPHRRIRPPSTPTARSSSCDARRPRARSSSTWRRPCRTTRGCRPSPMRAVTTRRRSRCRRTSCRDHPFDNGELAVRDELLAPLPRTPRSDAAAPGRLLRHDLASRPRSRPRPRRARRARLADNTIVIYSSDQGLAVGGRHGLMGKQNLYEHVKPPLIIAGPGIPHGQSERAGRTCSTSFPRSASWPARRCPRSVEGKSLLPIIEGTQAARARLAVRRLPRLSADDPRRALEAHPIQRQRRDEHAAVRSGGRSRRAPQPGRRLPGWPAIAGGSSSCMLEARRQFGDPIDFRAATLDYGA